MMSSLFVSFHLELLFLFDKVKGLARGKDNNERTLMGVRQRIIGTALYYLGDERCRAKRENRNETEIMREGFEFVTITRLGEMFGLTKIKMGHRLVEIGLREWNYKEYCPTPLAMTTGYCKATESDKGFRFYVWHREKTVKALEAAGYERVASTPHRRGSVDRSLPRPAVMMVSRSWAATGRRRFGSWARTMPDWWSPR